MASFNSLLFLTLLVAISALMAAPSVVEAQIRLRSNVINVTGTITGPLPCVLNTTLFPNNTFTGNPFGNATVRVRCGNNNTTVASGTADPNGKFSIITERPQGLVAALISYIRTARNCTAAVTTPLSICNSTLPSNGTFVSPLTRNGIERNATTRNFILLARSFRRVD